MVRNILIKKRENEMLYYIRLIVKLLIIIITLILFYKKLIKKNSSRKEKENSHTIEDEKKLRKIESNSDMDYIYGHMIINLCSHYVLKLFHLLKKMRTLSEKLFPYF